MSDLIITDSDNPLHNVIPPVRHEALATIPADVRPALERARSFYQASMAAQVTAIALQVLAGFELAAAKALMPETRGRKKKVHGHGLISTDEPEVDETIENSPFNLCVEAFGISRSMAYKCMQMAEKAKDRYEFLQALPLLDTPPSLMPEDQQGELIRNLHHVTQGQTQADFLQALGIIAPKNLPPPPPEIPTPARPQAERDREASMAELNSLSIHAKSEKWKALYQSELAQLEQFLREFHVAVDEELKSRAQASKGRGKPRGK